MSAARRDLRDWSTTAPVEVGGVVLYDGELPAGGTTPFDGRGGTLADATAADAHCASCHELLGDAPPDDVRFCWECLERAAPAGMIEYYDDLGAVD